MSKLVKEVSDRHCKCKKPTRKIVVEHCEEMQVFNILYYKGDKLLVSKSRTSDYADLSNKDVRWLLEGK